MARIALVMAVFLVLVAAACKGSAVTPTPSRPASTPMSRPSLQPEPSVPPQPEPGSSFIHAKGSRIVDGQGQSLELRGVNVEGWLQWQGVVFGAGFASEQTMAARLEKLVGSQELEQFRQAVYENFITENDFARMAELGFNVVRIPFNHSVLDGGDGSESSGAVGWKYLDQALEWAEKHGLYVILDLHSAPGGQSELFTADPDPQNLLWSSVANQDRTVALWQTIAARYRDRTAIAGYDLLNEPDPPDAQSLLALYGRIVRAIREVDPNHMIILEGAKLATDLSVFQHPIDPNSAYSFHTYALLSKNVKTEDVRTYAAIGRMRQMPVVNTEFGANTYQWIKQTIALFEDPANEISHWMFWTWKRVSSRDERRYVNLFKILPTQAWTQLAGWIASPGPLRSEPVRAEALAGMADFVQAIKLENNALDSETAGILTASLAK